MKIIVKDSEGNIEKEVQVNEKTPILWQLERDGVTMQSACHAGICWACICMIESGGENLDKSWFSEPGFPLAENEIMTCIWSISRSEGEVVLKKIY